MPRGRPGLYLPPGNTSPIEDFSGVLDRFFAQQQNLAQARGAGARAAQLFSQLDVPLAKDLAKGFEEDPLGTFQALEAVGGFEGILDYLESTQVASGTGALSSFLKTYNPAMNPEQESAWAAQAISLGAKPEQVNAIRSAGKPDKKEFFTVQVGDEIRTMVREADGSTRPATQADLMGAGDQTPLTAPRYKPETNITLSSAADELIGFRNAFRAENKLELNSVSTLGNVFAQVEEALLNNNLAAQQTAVKSFIKSIDESAVREGELEAFWSGLGLNQKVRTQILTAKGDINPEVIQMVASAGRAGLNAMGNRLRASADEWKAKLPGLDENQIGFVISLPKLGVVEAQAERSNVELAPAASDRVAGKTYQTPRGQYVWTGTGWKKP